MEPLTTLEDLRRHIALLACIEETEAPFVSCYLNPETGASGYRALLDDRARVMRATLDGEARADFDSAMRRIDAYLEENLRPDARGVALFSRHFRAGEFFLPMQFAAPLPDWIAVGPTPNLFHLMALKDTYDRYVVLLATPSRVRILEIDLGAVSAQAWADQPVLPQRVGSEWTREHYESRHEHSARFLEEQIALLQSLMAAGGQTHLILAGDPSLTAAIRPLLPASMAVKLANTSANAGDVQQDIVASTLEAFIAWEEEESQAVAARFIHGIRTQGLAAAGAPACIEALRQRRAELLLIARDYRPAVGWRCADCGAIRLVASLPAGCPECGEAEARPIDVKEALVRLAGQQGCPVEVVERCDPLMAMGGVGCLLRYVAEDSADRSSRGPRRPCG
jgi:hypothetical protein